MAKKRSKASREVKEAAESFSSFIKNRGRELANEISIISGKVKRIEKKSVKEYNFNLLGFVWPVISSLIGIICILLLIILLNVINLGLDNYFVSALAALFYNNLYLFFAISLFFGYADYIRSEFSNVYWAVEPVITSLGLVSVLWVFVTALNLANPYGLQNFFMLFAGVLYLNLDRIFFLSIALGYIVLFSKMIIKQVGKK